MRVRGRQDRPATHVRLTGVVTIAAGTAALVELSRRAPMVSGPMWVRRNHRGETVNLIAGPVVAVTASTLAAVLLPSPLGRPALTLGLVSGTVGLYDDIAGARPDQRADKGLRGHFRALRSGRVSAGAVKVVGVLGASLAAAGPLSSGPCDRILAAGVMAGCANLVNLFDLRPGRAAKATVLGAVGTLTGPAAGASVAVLGTALGVLPADLREKVMLGDSGANALGALVGYRLAAGSGPPVRAGILAVLLTLTVASEKVSFTRVIEATPGVRGFDSWGRLPAVRRDSVP